ncbi:ATP-binding protein [Flavobacterium sp. NRK F10]|uniref:histidine kinase n=1 Tax=Flavobacterium sediminis TaxID=2201181 RepID=A0A2U8QSD9_9FLAO|nr:MULTISPECIES: ATP-binding protein [Flavobacterium]AWM13021.1 hypothetical protein DI487_03515 [Flavobacterium sediminis]MCO6174177.1 ATP-binding protein [Flavobacterium sp. NRK F10]
MRKKNIVIAVFSVLLVIVNQFLIEYFLYNKKEDANLINLVGKQRMIGQKIALEFYSLQQKNKEKNISDIEESVQDWEHRQNQLKRFNTDMSKLLLSKDEVQFLLDDFPKLDREIAFVKKQLIEYKDGRKIDLEDIVANQDIYLGEMEKAIRIYTDHVDRKLWVVIFLVIFSNMIILLVGGYVLLSLKAALEEHKSKEIELEKANLTLKEKNKELEQFNHIASHDLKEPLRGISNFIQIIDEDHKDSLNDEVKSYLQNIEKASKRMEGLITSLLVYSRIGRNRELVLCDLDIVVKRILGDLEDLKIQENMSIEFDRLPLIAGYSLELKRLFQSLISNAIKFRRNDEKLKIEIRCKEIEGYYEFSVIDNGIGIEKRNFDKVFYIFQKLHNNKEYEGYGIGLTNCKKIVELHGGKIWIESVLGQGSIFKFTLKR